MEAHHQPDHAERCQHSATTAFTQREGRIRMCPPPRISASVFLLPEHPCRDPKSEPRVSSTSATTSKHLSTRRIPVQQQDELDQGPTRHDVRRRVRVLAIGNLQRLPQGGALHLKRSIHACAWCGKRRTCAGGFSARPASAVRPGTGEYKNYRNLYQSYFFQDDFKLGDRITLNFGARYEPTGPWHDLVGRFQYFDEEAYGQGVKSPQYANAPPGLFYRGDPGVPEDGTLPDRNNVAGRFGFAWDVTGDGKTSIRGGGGMFYDTHLQGDHNNDGVNAPPWSIRVNVVDSTTLVGPLSDPYRPRTDFNSLVHDYEDKDTIIGAANAPFPRPGARRVVRRSVQHTAHL